MPNKSNMDIQTIYNPNHPNPHVFFNTDMGYNKMGNFSNKKNKFKTNEKLEEEKDEKNKKLEILLNARNKAKKNFDQRVKNHLNHERNFFNRSNKV